jgi:hypothetical protein
METPQVSRSYVAGFKIDEVAEHMGTSGNMNTMEDWNTDA